ncbi:hypothetical protein BaRGS_00031720, partial [Batillaria attramentaria]
VVLKSRVCCVCACPPPAPPSVLSQKKQKEKSAWCVDAVVLVRHVAEGSSQSPSLFDYARSALPRQAA